MSSTVSDRALARLHEEIDRQRLTHRDLAKLTHWSPSKVSKLLTQHIGLRLNDLATLCEAVRLDLVECVREPGRELVADLTPSEMRLLRRWRQSGPDDQMAFAQLMRFTMEPPRGFHKSK